MEEKFIAAFESNRAAANLMGIRMRALDLKAAKRVLSGTRLSDGFNDLAAKGLELYEECLYSQDAYLADFVDTYGLEDPLTPGRIKQVAEIFQKELTMQ